MKFPGGVLIRAQPKGWVDENGTIDWLENVWNKRQGELLKKPATLIWDMFRAHKTDDVKKLAKKINTSLAVIPATKNAQNTNLEFYTDIYLLCILGISVNNYFQCEFISDTKKACFAIMGEFLQQQWLWWSEYFTKFTRTWVSHLPSISFC